jgi:hypothetical protein
MSNRKKESVNKTLVACAIAAIGLAACGGVDRDGTRDLIVNQFDNAGVEIDGDCVDDALGKFSDDELKELDEALSNNKETDDAAALMTDIAACAQP